MIIDSIGCSYDSLEELIERQAVIEEKIQKFIDKKKIADRVESRTSIAENRYYLTVDLIKD